MKIKQSTHFEKIHPRRAVENSRGLPVVPPVDDLFQAYCSFCDGMLLGLEIIRFELSLLRWSIYLRFEAEVTPFVVDIIVNGGKSLLESTEGKETIESSARHGRTPQLASAAFSVPRQLFVLRASSLAITNYRLPTSGSCLCYSQNHSSKLLDGIS